MSDEDELIPTRASLLSRLKDWQDETSWKVFFDTYWRLIYCAAIKAGLTDAEAQDVVQETVIAVMKHMPDFHYEAGGGSFKGWLLTLTNWRIRDQFRRRRTGVYTMPSKADASTETDPIASVADPASLKLDAFWDEEWERNLLKAAIERVKQKVDAKQYQIFDLHVLKDWPVRKVAGTLKVNVAQVYLAKHRVGKLIRKEVNEIRAAMI